ncbi:hypothetical protein DNTS_001644 [Danionella cerebrum]|uniref:Uncharacterized protein n=1 Tax=Danionella cerebrum TaxID=2873325 RepID=A0A553R032_9TELE|nr:hypothetical protein DNTS_001644 [Danionella translucida]
MLWLLEQKALLVHEEEFAYCIAHGMLGYRYPQTHPSLSDFISASEHQQIYDILAHNDIPPWELVGVFKGVLQDFLRRQEDVLQTHVALSAPVNNRCVPISPTKCKVKIEMAENAPVSLLDEPWRNREEIPTISSYVDKYLHASCPYVPRYWSLPFYNPFAYETYTVTV